MLKNYFLFAIRVLLKNRFYSFLNILGLSLGLTVSLIIFLYVQNELTYDTFHKKHKQIYQISSVFNIGGKQDNFSASQSGLAQLLKMEFPEIQNYCRINDVGGRALFKNGDKAFYEEEVVWADSTFFDVFDYNIIYGDKNTCLDEPNSIVLSKSMALKYFGEENVVGKSISTPRREYIIKAICEDVPPNSHFRFTAIISSTSFDLPRKAEELIQTLWYVELYSFLVFPENYNMQDFYDKFPAFYEKYMATEGAQYSATYRPEMIRIDNVHFNETFGGGLFPSGNLTYVYAFVAVGILILILAIINYMNLVTARSANRAKEIGMRKVSGATKSQLIFQFIGESFLLSIISLVIAFASVEIILSFTPFNNLIEKELRLNIFENLDLTLFSAALIVVVGFISGLYPAFYLSSINPVSSLKGSFKNTKGGLFFRKSLVTAQFVISIGVAIITILMNGQLNYIRNKNLGYNKENIVLINVPDTAVARKLPYAINELKKNENVLATTKANTVPGMGIGRLLWMVESDKGFKENVFDFMIVDHDYLKTMGIKLLEGRDFDKNRQRDFNYAAIVNESLVKSMGWKNALGKRLTNDPQSVKVSPDSLMQVIGVVQDFNTRSLHEPIVPTVIILSQYPQGSFHIRIKGDEIPETIAYIENLWKEIDPSRPFDYSFFDQKFNEQYREDEKQNFLLDILSVVCVVISLLGLLGLASYSTEQRTKEIAIRKVLGSETSQIIFLLFKEVLFLLIIATIIAAPLSHFYFNKWLQNFAFQVSFQFFVYFFVILIAFITTFITIAFHSLKAARTNPVYALKYE